MRQGGQAETTEAEERVDSYQKQERYMMGMSRGRRATMPVVYNETAEVRVLHLGQRGEMVSGGILSCGRDGLST